MFSKSVFFLPHSNPQPSLSTEQILSVLMSRPAASAAAFVSAPAATALLAPVAATAASLAEERVRTAAFAARLQAIQALARGETLAASSSSSNHSGASGSTARASATSSSTSVAGRGSSDNSSARKASLSRSAAVPGAVPGAAPAAAASAGSGGGILTELECFAAAAVVAVLLGRRSTRSRSQLHPRSELTSDDAGAVTVAYASGHECLELSTTVGAAENSADAEARISSSRGHSSSCSCYDAVIAPALERCPACHHGNRHSSKGSSNSSFSSGSNTMSDCSQQQRSQCEHWRPPRCGCCAQSLASDSDCSRSLVSSSS